MRIVTVCEHGNKRSVHAAFLMRHIRKVDGGGYNDVVAIGTDTSSINLQAMLFNWAEWIIVTDAQLVEKIPEMYKHKLHIWDVGPDVWPSTFDKDLLDKLRVCMEKEYSNG